MILQVYLHCDPCTRAHHAAGKPPLSRQRMYFLLLLPHGIRIVIGCDGVQHYVRPDGRAEPPRYAELVAEDRELRFNGYEVYRFGTAELVDQNLARQRLSAFFNRLAARHCSDGFDASRVWLSTLSLPGPRARVRQHIRLRTAALCGCWARHSRARRSGKHMSDHARRVTLGLGPDNLPQRPTEVAHKIIADCCRPPTGSGSIDQRTGGTLEDCIPPNEQVSPLHRRT